jgi:hypothetical protein
MPCTHSGLCLCLFSSQGHRILALLEPLRADRDWIMSNGVHNVNELNASVPAELFDESVCNLSGCCYIMIQSALSGASLNHQT